MRDQTAAPALNVIVASTFTATPIEPALRATLAAEGRACDLHFALYGQLSQALLAPESLSAAAPGAALDAIAVLVRVEDWLRAHPVLTSDGSSEPAVRQVLMQRLEELIAQLSAASARMPVILLCCPSRGWVAHTRDRVRLCHTITTLAAARARSVTGATVLDWPVMLAGGDTDVDDRAADRLGQIPFTQDCFDTIGRLVGAAVGAAVGGNDRAADVGDARLTLDAYLADLQSTVVLAPASPENRGTIDRLLASVSAFSSGAVAHDSVRAAVDDTAGWWTVHVADRTGDYGLAGALAMRVDGSELIIDRFVLGCPVLGKQVEFAVLSGLARAAEARGCHVLRFRWSSTSKNEPMRSFLAGVARPDASQPGTYAVRVAEVPERIAQTAPAPRVVRCSVRDTSLPSAAQPAAAQTAAAQS